MIHKFARFEVRSEALADAVAAIEAFVDEVRRKEGGTAVYDSFQETANPTRFTHYMVFRTPSAEEYHRKTAWCRAFVEKLYPLCKAAPEFTDVRPIGLTK